MAMISILKITKGHNSVNNVGRFTISVLCTQSNDTSTLNKVS